MQHLIRYSGALCLILVLLSIGGLKYVQQALVPNNELKIWFVENDPTLLAYQDFCAQYGNDRLMMIMVYDSAGIFQPVKIRQIKAITGQLTGVEGIQNVHSLTNLKDLFRVRINDTVRIKYASPFPEKITDENGALWKIRDQVLGSSVFVDHVINQQGDCSIIVIQLDAFDEVDTRRSRIIEEIELVARTALETDDIYLGGLDIFTNELNKLSKHDFGLFMGITYLVMFLLIYFFFRKWYYVLLSLVTMLISVLLSLSIYGLTGHQLNLFSLVVPPLIVILGLIHLLHIINQYEHSTNESDSSVSRQTILHHALNKVFKPCLFTALTTMIGFLSLLSSSTAILQEFGWFAALGIFVVFVCSFVFSAWTLKYIDAVKSRNAFTQIIGNHLIRLSKDILANPRKYWVAIGLLSVLAMYGVTKIKADMFVLEYFPESNQALQDHEFITRQWGNYFPIDFILTSDKGYTFKSASMLKSLHGFQKEVNSMEEIQASMCIINLVEKASEVLLRRDIDKLLSSHTQTIRLLDNLRRREEIDLSNFISDDYRTARIRFTGPLLSISELRQKIDQIKQISQKHFGDKALISENSFPALYLKIISYAVDSMMKSFGLAIALIFITLSILLKNVRLALVAMIPNLFPIGMMLACMGLAGINLDLTTATVASIALGIAVDDTIHILSHYQHERRDGKRTIPEAIINTHFQIGKIVVISSIVICVGYLVLLLASIKTVVYFGLLTLVAASSAQIGDLILLPLLLKTFRVKA